MRFINSQLYRSMQLYSIVNPQKSFEESIYQHCKNLIEVQDCFQRTIRQHFHKDILFADQVKELVFNEKGSINILNENLYVELQKISAKYHEYKKEAFDRASELAKTIRHGNHPKDIKVLARLRLHDAELFPFVLKETSLKMVVFRYQQFIVFIFSGIDNLSNTISQVRADSRIIYEEVIDNSDGTYEYNILIATESDGISKHLHSSLHELTIRFRDVKIETYDSVLEPSEIAVDSTVQNRSVEQDAGTVPLSLS